MSTEKNIQENFTPVIGLEVHAQLLTKTKIYNSDSASFGDAPNTNVSVITLAHPGTLPKLNKKVVEYAIKMGLACNCEISRKQIFDRKNYFYPDLPKGYQLTQDRTPICKGGFITIKTKDGVEKNIPLNRIHIEEDAGKSMHLEGGSESVIDYNRAGVALIEIVTEPAIHTSEEAGLILAEIRKIVRYLGICDGNMEEGSLRCDANVSVMPKGSTTLGKKVEVKNMNSIRNVQRAIDHEIERQILKIGKGNAIFSETRTFDANNGKTYGMRTKEELNDYRYFPDPDLSPLVVSDKWLNDIKASMPELPKDLLIKYVTDYKLPEYDALVLTESRDVAKYFEEICAHTTNYKAASNWVMGPVKSYLNENSSTSNLPSPAIIAELISMIDTGKINFSVASQKVFPELLKDPKQSPAQVAQNLNLIQDSSTDTILPIVKEVIKEFPLKVEEYKNGKKGIISMFMGEVMKRSKGKADPKLATELLVENLK
ncbi:MAG TPA: Asp-tRNA(Asn)/Glu-tRNA(Gln) amidotransferase subunit GatB [Cyclobacteriaceae bacterium]|nr:Asp-tRNA(Asn)/Glu-tRNA(Gln) amidotransferase subunit GatB [Cyclobacteriaceae bacterium]